MHGGDNRATEMTSKKKKRHQNQAAVYPVQQVQPQTGGDEDDFEKPAAEFETNPETAPEHSSHASDAPQPPERLRKTSGSVPVLNLMAQNEPAPPPLSSPLKSPHSSCRTFAVRTSPSPSPSTASLPALSDHRRESTSLCRMGSPRQSSRDLVLSYTKGIVTKPQPVSEADVVSSVVELVHEIIPLSSQPTHHRDQPEKIEWVDFQPMQKFGDRTKFMDVLLLGLARGFQIWTITESGNCEEVLSERQGPLRLGKLLPCEPESVEEGAKDKFVDMRPLFALVDSTFTKPETQFCCLSFLSLKSAKIVHKLNFEKPILNIQVSSKWLVIATGSSLVMCDVFTLQERKTIEAAVFPESLQVPFALRGSLLVFGDKKRRSEFLSCGGAADPLETPHSTYTGQMLSAVKSLSRTVTSVGGSSNKDDMKGVVTLVSLDSWNHAEEEFVKLHFVAQEDSISHMDLSPDARLLLTADSSACEFHVFSVLLHTASSTLAAAQHLYVLNRGSTLAKVMSTCFSNDSRWLCLATNHGTVHTFAISPYGGVPTARTHSGRLLNQQSKFARSAGLSSVDGGIIEGRRRRQSGVVHVTREHPSLRCASLARASGNPRIGPFPPPLVLNAVKKIRDRRLNSENLSAWASDLTPTSLTGGSKKTRPDAPKMALAFACRPVNNIKGTSVLVLRSDGVLCEYAIRPCVGQSSDEQIRIDVVPEASWTLYRTKDTADLVTPLSHGSPLMRWLSRDSVERSRADSLRIDPATEWNAQVEDTCSYSAPHRRLWQGPQFHFYCVNEAPEAVQVSAGDCGGTQSIPIVIGDGTYGSHATKVEWCGGSAGSERICEKERDEIAKQIADAMSELDLGMSSNQKEAERAEKTSLDDEFFDSADTASTSNEKAGRRGNSDEPLMSFDEDI